MPTRTCYSPQRDSPNRRVSPVEFAPNSFEMGIVGALHDAELLLGDFNFDREPSFGAEADATVDGDAWAGIAVFAAD